MPFSSKAQQRWAFANKKSHPEEMKNFDPHEWAAKTDFKKLPEKVEHKDAFDLGAMAAKVAELELTPQQISILATGAGRALPLGAFMGTMAGYGRGNTPEGLGRGIVAGSGAALGAGAGAAGGTALATGLGGGQTAQLLSGIAGLGLGGGLGYAGAEHLMGEPVGAGKKPEEAKPKEARHSFGRAKKKRRKRASGPLPTHAQLADYLVGLAGQLPLEAKAGLFKMARQVRCGQALIDVIAGYFPQAPPWALKQAACRVAGGFIRRKIATGPNAGPSTGVKGPLVQTRQTTTGPAGNRQAMY